MLNPDAVVEYTEDEILLRDYLVKDTDELIIEIASMLEDKGFLVKTDYENYIFGIPSSGQVVPVLLHTHVDTNRQPEDLPVILDLSEEAVMWNTNGRLGAQGRTGCYLIHRIIDHVKTLPFVLYTNHHYDAYHGMEEFIRSGELDPFVEDVYASISLTRRGVDKAVLSGYMSDIAKEFDIYGYECVEGIMGSGMVLSAAYEIMNVEVSAGFQLEGTKDEIVMFHQLDPIIHNMLLISQSIDRPYRCAASLFKQAIHDSVSHMLPSDNDGMGTAIIETPLITANDRLVLDRMEAANYMHYLSAYYPNPRCLVCNSEIDGVTTKGKFYYILDGKHMCDSCRARALKQSDLNPGQITVPKVLMAAAELAIEQSKTREANRKRDLGPVSLCPKCNSARDVNHRKASDSFYCDHCKIAFWVVGPHGAKYDKYTDQHLRVFINNGFSTYLEVDKEKIVRIIPVNDDPNFVRCSLCGFTTSVRHGKVGVYEEKNNPDQEIRICDRCRSEAEQLGMWNYELALPF